MKTLVRKISDFHASLRLANASRKGQKIETIDHQDGHRSYNLIINR